MIVSLDGTANTPDEEKPEELLLKNAETGDTVRYQVSVTFTDEEGDITYNLCENASAAFFNAKNIESGEFTQELKFTVLDDEISPDVYTDTMYFDIGIYRPHGHGEITR